MDAIVPDKFKERVAPQNRLEQERLIDAEYQAARGLLRKKFYKEALKKFKWVFANDNQFYTDLYPSEIRELTKHYPPAGAVVKRWRNDKERLILEQKADYTLIGQWNTLNLCLGEKGRTIDVFLKLQATGANDDLLQDVLHHVWKRLAVSKKYEHLRTYLPTLGFHVLLHAVEYDCAILFPGSRKLTKRQLRQDIETHIAYARQEGSLSHEIALGLGEKHVAAQFAKKILGIETSDLVYASLIKGAVRARAYAEAVALFNEAQTKFSLRRLRHCSKAIKAMPKSQLSRLSA
jgi:hypothetical protein